MNSLCILICSALVALIVLSPVSAADFSEATLELEPATIALKPQPEALGISGA